MSDTLIRLAVDDEGGPEIFHAIQGEGASTGAPRVFIRLSGCNLHCKWCDTAYTWNWEGTPFQHENDEKFDLSAQTITLSVSDIASRVAAYGPVGIVITGGEPLLQQSRLPELIAAIKFEAGPVWVEIETNGSIKPGSDLVNLVNQFNVSPKLAHSGNAMDIAQKPESLSFFASLPSTWFKFVIGEPEQIEEVRTLANRFRLPPDRIMLMPLGVSSSVLRSRADWLIPLCLEHGYRFSDRLHIHLYGNERGT